jgi:hypothetical protein
MKIRDPKTMHKSILIIFALATTLAAAAAPPNQLVNGELADRNAAKVPAGWRQYGKAPLGEQGGALAFVDRGDDDEAGITQKIPITEPGKYELVVSASLPDAEAKADHAYIQLRIQPQNQYKQAPLDPGEPGSFQDTAVGIEVPAGTTQLEVYIYTHKAGSPRFLVKSVKLGKVEAFSAAADSGKAPEISALKDLALSTAIAKNGRPAAVIAAGDTPEAQAAAAMLRDRIQSKSGAKIAVVDPKTVKLPLETSVIAIGARENNDLLHRLYRRGFLYTDQVYPGPGGHELRSLHNPTGGKQNVIIVGGSDEAGIKKSAELLAAVLTARPAGGNLELGFLMEIHAPGFTHPVDAYDAKSYWSRMLSGMPRGYGWNYVAAQMALFYQTGDVRYAKEFLRLAFPDAQAIRDFQKFNPESIETPAKPLSGPYHYMGHQMILLWDLIEEHPVFSDADRLKVTRAFAAQFDHPGIGPMIYQSRPGKRQYTGSRHHQWAAISLYALARYFDRDYPHRTWKNSLRSAELSFEPANTPDGWIEGERGIVGWFLSGSVNPAVQYFALAGIDGFRPDGGWANALKFFESQWDGSAKSAILGTAARQTFYLAAEQTGDGKYLYYADLLPPLDPAPKIGASTLPTGKIALREPVELLNCWTAAPMKESERRLFKLAAPAANCYLGLSWRDTLDTTGDFLSFNCFNEEYRTPYKLLSISNLRLDGRTVLAGLGNFVQIYRAGSTEAHIPTLGQVYGFGAAGGTVWFSGGVPDHAYADWRRDLLLRKRAFVLIADTATAREKQPGALDLVIHFQTTGAFADGGVPGKLFLESRAVHPVRNCRLSSNCDGAISSGSSNTLFETAKVGDRAIVGFTLDTPFRGTLQVEVMRHSSRAAGIDFLLDGKKIKTGVPHYLDSGDMVAETVSLGSVDLPAGEHELAVEVAATVKGNATAWIGLMNLGFASNAQSRMALTSGGADMSIITADGAIARRRFEADPAKPVTTFTLIGPEAPGQAKAVYPLGDCAALLRLPEKALAFAGSYADFGTAALALLERDHAAGSGATAVANLFKSSAPVAFDWNFESGEAVFEGAPGTTIDFSDGRSEKLAGPRLAITRQPAPTPLGIYRERLNKLEAVAAGAGEAAAAPRKIAPDILRIFPEKLTLLEAVELGGQHKLLAASGNQAHLFDAAGKLERTFDAGAPVTAVAAFAALNAVVVGNRDEQVTAYALDGKKLWTFTSVLAPEVEASQKYYWFKSAYPGIYALAAHGDRLYVGSACTMEVLDPTGKLLGRHAQTWGPTRQIVFIPATDGSTNTVGLRHSTADGNYMWTVNSKSGANRATFRDNLPGYKNFPSFGSLYRTKAFVADFDGDGREELLADSQGMYLWLNLYDGDGKPKYQLNLGPGDKNMRPILTGLAVGDFTGDAHPEAVLVSSFREVLAVDGRARPLWSAPLPFKGVKAAIRPASKPGAGDAEIIVAGGRQLAVYNGRGELQSRLELPDAVEDLIALPDRRVLLRLANGIAELPRD